jgi:hypothetical protein
MCLLTSESVVHIMSIRMIFVHRISVSDDSVHQNCN